MECKLQRLPFISMTMTMQFRSLQIKRKQLLFVGRPLAHPIDILNLLSYLLFRAVKVSGTENSFTHHSVTRGMRERERGAFEERNVQRESNGRVSECVFVFVCVCVCVCECVCVCVCKGLSRVFAVFKVLSLSLLLVYILLPTIITFFLSLSLKNFKALFSLNLKNDKKNT